ncbi:DUF6119 family protein [Streptomyces dysideae]|uniref:Sporadically distributed protein, TIGR04141 family n=1 Tax=Streptomyces dysideae TaxID=909626 RepID=A0A101V1Q8_9ACTN|nr:DUF6119 family protein [Streptomyces dysideae]KUO20853.1 hypothetical protein AQJ91_13220 [Streptomyces dysideae]
MTTSTTKRTLYRLPDVAPTLDAMFDALDHDHLASIGADIRIPEGRLTVPSLVVTAPMEKEEASWIPDVTRTTGLAFSESVRRPSCLHLLAVDDHVYAIGYDQGFRLIPNRLKDKRFGLSFAIRQVDPMQVQDLAAQALGVARTDITIAPGGVPVLSLGVQEHSQIVRRLGGYLDGRALTRARTGRGEIFSADGGCGLRLPLGIEAEDLVADIREIARVCREVAPQPALEFVEHIVPLKDDPTVTRLEQALDQALGEPADGRIASTIPMDHWEDCTAAHAVHIKINSSEAGRFDQFDLEYVLRRACIQRAGQRLEALKQGTVSLYRHHRATAQDLLTSTTALRWIEANLSLGSRRFCLLDGEWYEIGATYLDAVRSSVARLFAPVSSVNLPPWRAGDTERTYNAHVPDQIDDYVCMDRKNARNPLRPTTEFEVCDLLTSDGTLVMVKHAHGGSGPLSHLFSQGLVAVQLLQKSAEVRAEFAQRVFEESKGKHVLPDDFMPKRVVFAILLKHGTTLTPETLFPFSQVTLAQTAKTLESWGVTVEVVGIPEEASAADARPEFRAAA